jgi:ribose/xylose/arabinose/galactoside ABC-type transport system permease subunit
MQGKIQQIRQLNMRDLLTTHGFLLIIVLYIIVLALTTNYFFTISNFISLFHSVVPLTFIALGLSLVVFTGELDISIGSIAFLSSTFALKFITGFIIPPLTAIFIIMLIGILCGAVNGFLVVGLKINSFIASLGTMFAFRGLALLLTGGFTISIPDSISRFAGLQIGSLYVDFLIALVFLIFIYLLHARIQFGRHLMAIGNDADVAYRMGVKVKRCKFMTFLLSGLFAGIGGLFLMLQVGSITPYMGMGFEFEAIAAMVIGGISLFGGQGSILPGFLLGVLSLAIIENGLNHLGVSPYVYPFVRGGIIFIAMYADTLRFRV